MEKREEGPVEILCKEIGYRFDKRLERPAVLVAFVRVLVAQVATMRRMQDHLTKFTGKAPSAGSADVLARVEAMLTNDDPSVMIVACAELHNLCHELNPDEAYPTDHLIDMLSSCVSAIRFGLGESLPLATRRQRSAAHLEARLRRHAVRQLHPELGEGLDTRPAIGRRSFPRPERKLAERAT